MNKKNVFISIFFVLLCAGLYFSYKGMTYGKYSLSPNETMTIMVSKNDKDLENYTELIINNEGGNLELTGQKVWNDSDNSIFYNVENQVVTELRKTGGAWETIKSSSHSINGITLGDKGIVINSKGRRTFALPTAEASTIKIRNLSKYPINFETYIVYK